MSDYGKRTRVIPTRAGMVTETFYVCYYCPEELHENELATHNHGGTNN